FSQAADPNFLQMVSKRGLALNSTTSSNNHSWLRLFRRLPRRRWSATTLASTQRRSKGGSTDRFHSRSYPRCSTVILSLLIAAPLTLNGRWRSSSTSRAADDGDRSTAGYSAVHSLIRLSPWT